MLVEELSHALGRTFVLGNHPWGAWGSGCAHTEIARKTWNRGNPHPKHPESRDGTKYKIFLFFPSCLCRFSSTFPGTLRCSCAVPSRNVLPAAASSAELRVIPCLLSSLADDTLRQGPVCCHRDTHVGKQGEFTQPSIRELSMAGPRFHQHHRDAKV